MYYIYKCILKISIYQFRVWAREFRRFVLHAFKSNLSVAVIDCTIPLGGIWTRNEQQKFSIEWSQGSVCVLYMYMFCVYFSCVCSIFYYSFVYNICSWLIIIYHNYYSIIIFVTVCSVCSISIVSDKVKCIFCCFV